MSFILEGPVEVWTWETPRGGELVPDSPPLDLTPYLATERRINWVDCPETQHLACGCDIIRNQLMVSDACPTGHPTLRMRSAD